MHEEVFFLVGQVTSLMDRFFLALLLFFCIQIACRKYLQPDKWGKDTVTIDPPPGRGDFDIDDVRSSKYFFN